MNIIKIILNIIISVLNYIAQLVVRFFSYISVKLNNLSDKLDGKKLEQVSFRYDQEGKYLEYTFFNKTALNAYEGVKAVYLYLLNDESYLSFGNNKVLITFVKAEKTVKTLHYNVAVKNTTAFEDFYSKVKDRIESLNNQAYPELPYIEFFTIRVWNVDSLQNKRISLSVINC